MAGGAAAVEQKPLGLPFATMKFCSVMFSIVFHVVSIRDVLSPLGLFNVPVNGVAKILLKADPWVPAKFLIDFCRIHGIFSAIAVFALK